LTHKGNVRLSQAPPANLIDKAVRPLSATPRPFLKWAGSKRYLLKHLVDLIPREFGTYYEPFLGGGAMFFLLEPRVAHLSDSVSPLIDTFIAVRDNPRLVLKHLEALKPDPQTFYDLRAGKPRGRYMKAAQFLYLNKTAWNGLYRVNSRGEFNVPYGGSRTQNLVDQVNLFACANILKSTNVRLTCEGYASALAAVQPGDLVFLDPPYVTGHTGNGFIDYNECLFSWRDQLKLADIASDLDRMGAQVIVTNVPHPDVVALYRRFRSRNMRRQSTIAASVGKRGNVQEVVFYSRRLGPV
jgi:DNA adenine methylase